MIKKWRDVPQKFTTREKITIIIAFIFGFFIIPLLLVVVLTFNELFFVLFLFFSLVFFLFLFFRQNIKSQHKWMQEIFNNTIKEHLETNESITFVKSNVDKDLTLHYEEITLTKEDLKE
jgi:ABC-type multidrug transport system fused ATPase/permease subunit